MKTTHTFFALMALLLISFSAAAQTAEVADLEPHKLVIQLTSQDSLVHKNLIKQMNNIMAAAPNTQIEVVCHNQGISFLVTAKTLQAEKVRELKARGVVFAACENTLRDRKIKREDLLPEATTVPSGVLEIVKKQRKKWAYLKAG